MEEISIWLDAAANLAVVITAPGKEGNGRDTRVWGHFKNEQFFLFPLLFIYCLDSC